MDMHSFRSRDLEIAINAAILVTAFAITSASAAPLPALYSAQQKTDGQAVFAENCASCHGSVLEGGVGPTLAGQHFSDSSDHNSVGSMFSFLSTQMPDGSGGSLTHKQYEDVMAFILYKNGYPAGTRRLDFASAQTSKVPLVSQVK